MPLVTFPKTAWQDVPRTSHGRWSEQGLADDSHKDTTASAESLPERSRLKPVETRRQEDPILDAASFHRRGAHGTPSIPHGEFTGGGFRASCW